MNPDFIRKVIANIDAQKIYEMKKVQDLVIKGTKLYPDYNLKYNDSIKVIEYVFKNIKPEYRSKELHNKLFDGMN